MAIQKVALVTGASSGIGKATALKLLADGLTVYVAARRVENMRDLEAKGAVILKMDITKEEDIVAVMNEIKKNYNGVDVLVNNAGYAIYGAVEDTTIEDARRQFEVNIFGLASLTQKVLPYMREKKTGIIINISSIGGKIYTPLGAWYYATKHALEGWSDSLRLELNPFGIDVVIIEPGLIVTEFGDVMSQPLLDRSGNTAYSKMAYSVAKATKENYDKESASSSPSVIANVIAKAVKARKPKTRYVAGKLAKPLMFMRWLVSDKMFDKVIMSQVK